MMGLLRVEEADEARWDPIKCVRLLNNQRSSRWTRLAWVPMVKYFDDLSEGGLNVFDELCLLKRRGKIEKEEEKRLA